MIVNSDRTLAEAVGKVKREFEKHKYISIKIDTRKRSSQSNSLQFHWYKELAQQSEDTTESHWRCYCKYHFGLAIRAEADQDFADDMYKPLKAVPYESRLKVMRYVDVTSKFNRDQMSRYLNEIKQHFEPEGFVLTNSEDISPPPHPRLDR